MFSRSSRIGSAGEDLVSEGRECEAQSKASAEESREGVEEAENARRSTIEAQSGGEGVEEAENARRPTIEAQSGEESREGEGVEESENARWPTIEAQSGEESREDVEEADTAHWSAIEAGSDEEIMEGGFEGELHEETQGLSGRDVLEEGKLAGEAREPCICDGSLLVEPPNVSESEKLYVHFLTQATESEIMVEVEEELHQARELSGRDGNEELDIVEDSLRAGISESIGTLSAQLKEGETIGSLGVQSEEGEIVDSPRAEVEERDMGLEEGEIIDSTEVDTRSEDGEIFDSPGTDVEEGDIIDSPRAAIEDVGAGLEDGEIIDSPRAEVEEGDAELEEGEIVYSPWAKGSSPFSEQIADWMRQSRELLEKKTNSDSTKALEFISKAMSISMLSENLMDMKAEALLMIPCYEDVIQLCEHTCGSSEKNSVTTDMNDEKSCGNRQVSLEKLWRLHLMAKAYFYMGRFEEAMELLQKHEEVEPVAYMSGNMLTESSKLLLVKITKLLGFRAVGNEAFQSKRFSEAIEHYTAALAFSVESRPFSAICFYDRAIANQELGKIVDAIADCSLAIVLDQRYVEAISRRATLHELIRDYEQAANDLKMLISILESQMKVQGRMFRISKGLCKRQTDLEQARLRLCTLKEQARKGTRKDIYKILGVERSSSMTDVKNAYRRAALKHHPDKSGLLLIKSENVNDDLWREVLDQIRLDADKLFKLIGEAYDILSNASKRQEYDEEEDEEKRVRMWSSNRSGPHAGYEQRRNPYDFNQEYGQRRNPYAFSQGYDFSQGYEQRRNHYDFSQGYDFNRRGPRTGNERCEQRSNANDFNQGYNQRSNASYFNRSDSRSSKERYGRNGYGFNKDFKQRRNGPDFTRGYDHRSSTGYQERSYTSNFYRRYPHFNYQDLDAQYDEPGKWWDGDFYWILVLSRLKLCTSMPSSNLSVATTLMHLTICISIVHCVLTATET